MKKYNASMQQMADLQTQRELANKDDKEAYKVKKQTFDLLPNAEENIAKLQVSSTGCLLVQGKKLTSFHPPPHPPPAPPYSSPHAASEPDPVKC